MPQHRTKQIERSRLLAELAAVCQSLHETGVSEAQVSFGWDSNLPIEKMWSDQAVPIQEIVSFVANSERSGVSKVGKSDIFVESPGFLFTLCHEGDAHVKGESPLVEYFVRRWQDLGYEPYQIQQRA